MAIRSVAKWLGIALLGGYAAISLSQATVRALEPAWSQDLLPPYKSSRLWLHGKNPYLIYSDSEWEQTTGDEPLPKLAVWVDYAFYPPVALVNLAMISWLPWQAAKTAWLALNLVLSFAAPFMIWRLCGRASGGMPPLVFLLLWFSSMGFRIGLANGQHTLWTLSAILAGFLALRSRRDVVAGLCFALSLHKFHIAAPFFLLLAAKRRFRSLGAAAAIAFVILVVFFARTGPPVSEVIAAYGTQLDFWLSHSDLGTPRGAGSTELYGLLAAFLGHSRALGAVVVLAILAALTAIAWSASRIPEAVTEQELATVSLFTLWALYNNIYNTVLIALPALVLYQVASRQSSSVRRTLLWTLTAALAAGWIGYSNHPAKILPPHIAGALDWWFDKLMRLSIFAAFLALGKLGWLDKRPPAVCYPGMDK